MNARTFGDIKVDEEAIWVPVERKGDVEIDMTELGIKVTEATAAGEIDQGKTSILRFAADDYDKVIEWAESQQHTD